MLTFSFTFHIPLHPEGIQIQIQESQKIFYTV